MSKWLVSLACLVVASFAVFLPGADGATKRILLVGDSYAQYMRDFQSFESVLSENGLDTVAVEGSITAIGGTTAAQFATNTALSGMEIGLLDAIAYSLVLYPTIDIVHVSLGGNDLLNGGWSAQSTASQAAVVLEQIRENIQAVVTYILAVRSDIRVVLCDYDYFNFVETVTQGQTAYNSAAKTLWTALGQPTPQQLNAVFVALGLQKLAIANATDRCEYVQNWGLMQYWFGYAPGIVAETPSLYPGSAPTYLPYPGGVPTAPTPPAALNDLGSGKRDPLHLSSAGFRYIAQNCFNQYYEEWLASPSPSKATNPAPASGSSVDLSDATMLQWNTGTGAVSHKVYFGTDASALPLLATQQTTEFALPALNEGTTYYWRIDEVAGTQITAGDVWQFSVAATAGCAGTASGTMRSASNVNNSDGRLLGAVCLALALGGLTTTVHRKRRILLAARSPVANARL